MILDMARKEFCESGYQFTAVSDIAGRLAISEATIFKYFPSKLDLLNSVIERWYQDLFGDYSREVSFISGAREKLRYLIWRHLLTIRDQPAMCRLMFTEVRHQEGYPGSVLRRMNQQYTGLFLGVIEQGAKQGEFRGDLPVELLRDFVFGGIEHHAWAYLYNNGSLDADRVADQLACLLCEGIEPVKPVVDDGIESRLSRLVGQLEQQLEQIRPQDKES